MKIWKKNMITLAVLLVVCAGIYLNWRYSEATQVSDLTDTLDAQKVLSEDALVMNPDDPQDAVDTATDYFAAVRLSRQQARDSAVSTLQEAMAYDGSEQAEGSSAQLDELVQTALSEAQIESLVIAKGYTDCVAYMSDQGISVAVAAPEGGLKAADVAVIKDIVLTQSAYDITDIRVVEVR